MTSESNACVSAMRKEWNQLSRENAFYYIKSLKHDWPEEEFWQSGEGDVATLVDPFLRRVGFSPDDKTMLEIGCGVGRMSFALARRFGKVEAADISTEMVARAQGYQQEKGVSNVRFQVVSGQDLNPYPDESVDFVFSYIVLQHIPNISVILNYVREMGRVLKTGGSMLFQVNGFHRFQFPGGRYLYWGISETGRLKKWNVNSRPCLRFGKLNSWSGVPVSIAELTEACRAASLGSVQFTGIGSQYMWVSGKKIAAGTL